MKEMCAPLQPSCTLAPRQSLGRWGMLSSHLLQGPCLLSLKTSAAVCSWSLPSLYSLLISTSLSHRGRLIIAFGTCDTGRGGGRIPMGLDVLLKTSRMLRDNSLVPNREGAVPTAWLMPGDDMGPSLYAGGREVDRGYPKAQYHLYL